ncbi:hypothetical protein OAB62_01220 [Pseudomonadales bacterium]|nr:hypothetical protein [Pseudomonadales bacterium]
MQYRRNRDGGWITSDICCQFQGERGVEYLRGNQTPGRHQLLQGS